MQIINLNYWQKNRSFLLIFLSIIYIIFAKIGSLPSVSLIFSLVPIVLTVLGLTLLSPPVAAALVFMSHNLIGQITMNHPGFLVQVIPALSFLIAVLYVRRNEFLLLLKFWKVKRPEALGFLVLVAILLFAFFNSIISQSGFSVSILTNLFKASHGGNFSYYPYVFISRWGLFILIGALCCRGYKELQLFLLSLSIFVVTQLIAIPFDHYKWVFSDMCTNRLNYTGLQALNVNRAYLGYLLACSSVIMLSFGLFELKRRISLFYYFGSLVFLFFCVVAGSKGPVLAAFIAFSFLFLVGGKKAMIKVVNIGVVFLILTLGAMPILGCQGGFLNLFRSSLATAEVSVSVRADLAKTEYKKTTERNIFRSLFGGGLGASLSTVESTFLNPHDGKPISVVSSSGSHNLFLDFYVDLGLFGLIGFIASLVFILFCFFRNLKSSPKKVLLTFSMGGVLLILLVYSILATAPSMATIQAMFIGLLVGVGFNNQRVT